MRLLKKWSGSGRAESEREGGQPAEEAAAAAASAVAAALRFIFSVSGEPCGLSAILRHFLPPAAENTRQENRPTCCCCCSAETLQARHRVPRSPDRPVAGSCSHAELLPRSAHTPWKGRVVPQVGTSGLVSSHTLTQQLIVHVIKKKISFYFLGLGFFFSFKITITLPSI